MPGRDVVAGGQARTSMKGGSRRSRNRHPTRQPGTPRSHLNEGRLPEEPQSAPPWTLHHCWTNLNEGRLPEEPQSQDSSTILGRTADLNEGRLPEEPQSHG